MDSVVVCCAFRCSWLCFRMLSCRRMAAVGAAAAAGGAGLWRVPRLPPSHGEGRGVQVQRALQRHLQERPCGGGLSVECEEERWSSVRMKMERKEW